MGIESHLFQKSHFDSINKLVEAHSYHFTPLDSLNESVTDTDDDSDLTADVDPDTLMYQSIPSLTIPPPQTPGNFFERANAPLPLPLPGHKESAKPRPLGQKNHAKTPPPGQLFSKIQQKPPQNMRHKL